jgi:hypothetical protein
MRDLDIKSRGEVDNDMLYHNMLQFYLIDFVVVEIARHTLNARLNWVINFHYY